MSEIWFQVHGQITYPKIVYCSCEFCEGHDMGERTVAVNRVVRARDEIEAEAIAAGLVLDEVDTDSEEWVWTGIPVTEELPEDQYMAAIGAPALPLP